MAISTKKLFNVTLAGLCLWGVVIIHAKTGTEHSATVLSSTAEYTPKATTDERVTTEASQTTIPTHPGTFGPPPTDRQPCNFNISDGGKICVKLEFFPLFEVEYTSLEGNKEIARIPMPSKTKASGKCAKDETGQSIAEFSWGGGKYRFKITFQTDLFNISNEGRDARIWEASSLQFIYDSSDLNYFTNNSDGIVTVQTDPEESYFKTSYNSRYFCINGDKMNMKSRNGSNKASVTFGDGQLVQMQAFLNSNTGQFSSDGSNCMMSKGENSAISVGVGAALGCVILLVIIAYAIARRLNGDDSRTGYKSVD